MKSSLIFQESYWFIPVCLVVGIAYAWLLYTKKTTLNRRRNWILAIFRTILVSLICFLLLNPFLKNISNRTLKPLVVLGVDQSSSIKTGSSNAEGEVKNLVNSFIKEFDNEEFDLVIKDLNGKSVAAGDSLSFTGKKTDFGNFFRTVEEEFDGQNLRKVILLSDGIANTGVSPLARNFPFSIETIGIGDTTIRKDISIKGLIANKLAYLGNTFPIQVEINAHLYSGRSTTVQLSYDDEVIDRKIVAFTNDDDYQVINFNVQAKDIGKQLYSVQVLPLEGENSTRNNSRDVLIEVIDGKEKVLIVAQSPHPDLKAMKAILERNELFEVKVNLLSSGDNPDKEDFDLLILHQLPNLKGTSPELVAQLLGKLKPTVFVLGSQSDLSRFNGMQQVLGVNGQSGRIDKVNGTLNLAFNRFRLNENYTGILDELPPISAPFGEYQIYTGTDVILYQRVGSIPTERPLIAINTNVARKTAVIAATGLWQWRLEEFYLTESQEAVDDLFLKTLQLVSVKDNKDKLRVYPIRNEFDVDETIILQNEAYNDLYERIYGIHVNLQLQKNGETGKAFSYDITEVNSRFEISKLSPGIYTYSAEAEILGTKQTASGQFAVKDQDLEHLNTTADFNFLRTLADKNGGRFYPIADASLLIEELKSNQIPGKIISADSLKELINIKWILFILLLLATFEWVTRKYFGTY